MIRIEEVWSEEIIRDFASFAHRVVCPICGNETFNNWTICPHCQWEYDHSKGYSDANGTYKWVYRLRYRFKKLFQRKRKGDPQ